MFFLGGFNSIFPHLIYLSLIWAFLIIGFSGRITMFRAEKLLRSEEISLQESHADYTANQFLVNLADGAIPGNSDIIICLPESPVCSYIYNPPEIKTKTLGNIDYRGPPVF